MNTSAKSILWTALATAMISQAVGAPTAQTLECSGRVHGKLESFHVRMSPKNEPMFWSKNQMVAAEPHSYFSWLTQLDSAPTEGSARFIAKDGTRVMSLTHPDATVLIGVLPSKTMSHGFYESVLENIPRVSLRVPLKCKALPSSPQIAHR